jgi:nicotinate-nucleotide pyrophosphorylase (carboxylating)
LDQSVFKQLLTKEIEQMCQFALEEDLAGTYNCDITAELIAANCNATAKLITRENGVLCGTRWVEKVFEILQNRDNNRGKLAIHWHLKDGEPMQAGQEICELSGNARQILTGERSAMNFLQSLSATATLTQKYIKVMNSNTCRLLDTRKTIPGLRFGQKYAVSCGGGTNHRIGLSDAFLIKENHIMACGGIKQALKQAITNYPDKLLEIEVESIDELNQALAGKAEVIMLDNFNLEDMREARSIVDQSERKEHTKLEASGNVNLMIIADIAATGVDYISVGALTKDIKAVDLSLRVQLG